MGHLQLGFGLPPDPLHWQLLVGTAVTSVQNKNLQGKTSSRHCQYAGLSLQVLVLHFGQLHSTCTTSVRLCLQSCTWVRHSFAWAAWYSCKTAHRTIGVFPGNIDKGTVSKMISRSYLLHLKCLGDLCSDGFTYHFMLFDLIHYETRSLANFVKLSKAIHCTIYQTKYCYVPTWAFTVSATCNIDLHCHDHSLCLLTRNWSIGYMAGSDQRSSCGICQVYLLKLGVWFFHERRRTVRQAL